MPFNINKCELESLREKFPKGTKVKLIKMDDPHMGNLTIGCVGTVSIVDDIGTIHINWNCGSSLGVAYKKDICIKID